VRLDGLRFDHFADDGHGGLLYVTSKAGPGRRGQIAVSYYTNNRAFAATLPGVRDHFPMVLESIGVGIRELPLSTTLH